MTPLLYLEAALSVMWQHALMRHEVDWERISDEARRRCTDATSVRDTYPTIEWALTALGDGHSFFSPPERGTQALASGQYQDEVRSPSASIDERGLALLVVPSFRGSPQQIATYAGTLGDAIQQLAAKQPQGWIVDVTDNPGGNMLPMLAGLAPLLGAGTVGFFVDGEGTHVTWRCDTIGGFWLDDELMVAGHRRNVDDGLAHSPVAVLIGPRTASSGEAVVVAFRGRDRTRTFGQPTRGLTTCNDTFDLADGATIVLTVARFADRHAVVCDGPVLPDETVSTGAATYDAAATWVLGSA